MNLQQPGSRPTRLLRTSCANVSAGGVKVMMATHDLGKRKRSPARSCYCTVVAYRGGAGRQDPFNSHNRRHEKIYRRRAVGLKPERLMKLMRKLLDMGRAITFAAALGAMAIATVSQAVESDKSIVLASDNLHSRLGAVRLSPTHREAEDWHHCEGHHSGADATRHNSCRAFGLWERLGNVSDKVSDQH